MKNEILPMFLFISSSYKKLTSKQKDLLHCMRHYCISENCKDGIIEFTHSMAVEYGLYPKSNTRDLYKDINALIDLKFIEKCGQGVYGKFFYKLRDIEEQDKAVLDRIKSNLDIHEVDGILFYKVEDVLNLFKKEWT